VLRRAHRAPSRASQVIYCIRPIESIMQMMRDFSNNPLDKMKTQTLAGTHRDTTELVEAVSKIASLLQIGFGEAGATIIGQNLANGGDINPMASAHARARVRVASASGLAPPSALRALARALLPPAIAPLVLQPAPIRSAPPRSCRPLSPVPYPLANPTRRRAAR
jgi:hypothetical protein